MFLLASAFLPLVATCLMALFRQGQRGESRDVAAAARVTTWMMLALGLVLVIAGSEAVVRGTVALAQQWGMSQSVIAIVIIGAGSSRPELSISIGALHKRRPGLSVGNLIGSKILDALLPAGLAALIHPLTVETDLLLFDFPLLVTLTAICPTNRPCAATAGPRRDPYIF